MKNILEYASFIVENFDSRQLESDYNTSYTAALKAASKILPYTILGMFSPKEQVAIRWYAEDGAYDLQRYPNKETCIKYKKELEEICNHKTHSAVIVYSGVKNLELIQKIKSMTIGQTYSLPSFLSTTIHYQMAAQMFTSNDNKTIMQIHLPVGSYARYISMENTPNQYEAEVLVKKCDLLLTKIEETTMIDDKQGTYSDDKRSEYPIVIYHFDARNF